MEQIKEGDYIKGYNSMGTLLKLPHKYVGLIAKVISVIGVSSSRLIKVEFSDGYTWHYLHNEALEHLCTQDMIDFEKGLDANANDCLEDTPFHKPDFSHLKEEAEKGVDIKFESKSVDDLKLENLKNEEPKLFSILLSKDKDRRIVIDQTKEQIDLLVESSKGWHVIVIEQQQDKGIQIVIKS